MKLKKIIKRVSNYLEKAEERIFEFEGWSFEIAQSDKKSKTKIKQKIIKNEERLQNLWNTTK